MFYKYLSVILLLGMLTGQIAGQNPPSASSPLANKVQYCNESSNMAFDINKFAGTWYGLAINPAPSENYLCAQLNLVPMPNNTLNISLTYSNTPLYPWVNNTMYGNLMLQSNNTEGYNLSLTLYGKSYPMNTYKVLNTNYVNYTFICGYRNISDMSTYFATIFTRERQINSTILSSYENMAQANYSLFSNTSMTTISQPLSCSTNDGISTAHMVSLLMVLLYAIIASFC